MKRPFELKLAPRHREVLTLVGKKRFRLLLAMLCMLVEAGGVSATAYLMKPVVDHILVNNDMRMLNLVPLAIVAVYAMRGVAIYYGGYLLTYVGQDIIRRLRDRLYEKIQDLPLTFFQKETTGGLMSRIINDVNFVREMVSSTITSSLRDLFTIIGLIVVLISQIWYLALFALLVLPAAFFPIFIFGRKVRRTSTGCQEEMARIGAFLHETFAGNKIVKAFGMESFEKKRFIEKSQRLFKMEMKEARARLITSPINLFLGGVAAALIIWYGGHQVLEGAFTAGSFVAFLTALILLYRPIKNISNFNNAIQRGLAATDRIFDIIETSSEIVEDPHPVEIQPGPHRVTFDEVRFKYQDEMVLNDIHLDVKSGEVLAIAGTSGGGKTSLVNLIPRFYDVSSGSICIDGLDIRKASIASLRKQIAIVTQEPILFNDTVRNNIAYGRWDASDEEIVAAAKAAYAYDFIQGFPQRFDTSIGELGSRLSGGEKQRICIARALLKDAPILILDEATSSLDTESEKLVQKALENLMQGRTTFVIAHRLSTIAHANRIIVMVQGRIVEQGSHGELMDLKGEYFRLNQAQLDGQPAGRPPKAN